ncbi:distal membrane-arm assembly complex protein 1 [Varanus komodoensis]|nr:distal membrane-arm assembly complex protein 1 [Varanus komodoensis]
MAPEGGVAAPPGPRKSSCWSCRVLGGAGLMGAAWWVYLGPRRFMQQGHPPTFWHVTQMTFAVSLACFGVVTIFRPVGSGKKES